jgi:hypothetical protein
VRGVRFAIAALTELVSLLVDDALTFIGAAVGLAGTYLLAHEVDAQSAGYLMYAVVWAFLALSLARAARR